MFKVNRSETFSWPVAVAMPVDGGKYDRHTFDVTFKRLTRAEVEALREKLLDASGDPAHAARGIVTGWSGVEDDTGPIPFSDEAFTRVLDIQGVAASIMAAFFEASYGAARKN